jgi:REP element-mobilizing transposase RayT
MACHAPTIIQHIIFPIIGIIIVATINMGYRGRRSIRLAWYDYRTVGFYFVTICTNNKENVFGWIENNKMVLNKYGIIARNEWIKISQIRTYVALDIFIIMPDHVHGILKIKNHGDDRRDIRNSRGMARHAPTNIRYMKTNRRFAQPIARSLPTIIGAYKSSVTREINKLRNTWCETIWQRNYYELIIRSSPELMVIRKYIRNNPENHK